MELEETYRRLADGDPDPGDLSWSRRALHQLALERALQGDADTRFAALKVSVALGARYGLPVIYQLMEDPDPRVRTLAFNQAVASREDGLASLRRAAGGTDPTLALAAFELLVGWMDPHTSGIARRALSGTDPRLRAKGAELLGLVAGRGVLADLRRLAADPDAAVRAAAEEAEKRILGESPKPVRLGWWDGTPPQPLVPSEPPSTPEAQPVAEIPASAQLPAVVAPPDAPPPEPDASPTDGRWAALPATLPSEARALVRLLGMVGPEHRPAVLEQLEGRTPELAALWSSWSAGDRALSRGLALSASALGYLKITSRVTAMLADPDGEVRAAAAECLGKVGAPGSIPSLAARLGDPDPEVAVAAIRALTALALRLQRPNLARDQLARVGGSPPEAVLVALAEARTRLG